MARSREDSSGFRQALVGARAGLNALVLVRGLAALLLAGVIPASAQQSATTAASLVFDGVTVVDVEQGKLVPDQRVVIAGNRIQTIGDIGSVNLPKGAQVVGAQGKYLIPGLWDMHVHTTADMPFPLLIANGVTGIRDAWSYVPLDSMLQWRREILGGIRVGPPRQLLTGDHASLHELTEEAIATRKAAGANFIKLYPFNFAAAAAARHVGIPFGGHVHPGVSAIEASDSGMSIIDHVLSSGGLDTLCLLGNLVTFAGAAHNPGTIDRCQPVAERLRHNGTWWAPTLISNTRAGLQVWPASASIDAQFKKRVSEFWAGSPLHGNWLRDSTHGGTSRSQRQDSTVDLLGALRIVHRLSLLILAGTDSDVGPDYMQRQPPGFSLHVELAMLVAEGLTPLEALQAATLNPAKLLHGTDSLGTVTPGKLADLVLLDADPLADITNTTTIRAVVANGRYYDRAALDQLVAEVQAQAKRGFKYWWSDGERHAKDVEDTP